jgi:hypothetical protein
MVNGLLKYYNWGSSVQEPDVDACVPFYAEKALHKPVIAGQK